MELVKHEIWNIISGCETLDDFYNQNLNKVVFKPQVPSDIVSHAGMVEKILLHSFYEYEFIDIALTHAVFTFEKAMRVRWNEIHGKETQATLKTLIDWFSKNSYFETRNERFPHLLREIRNGNVHAVTKSLGGIIYLRSVYYTFDLINDLYENPQLRISRKEKRLNLANELAKFTVAGTILSCSHGRLIINGVFPVFVNNKVTPNTLSLLVSPIFDLTRFEKGEHYTPPHFTLKITDWSLSNDMFQGIDCVTGNPIQLTLITDEENRGKYDEWYVQLRKIREWGLIQFLVTDPEGDIFISELRNFHAS